MDCTYEKLLAIISDYMGSTLTIADVGRLATDLINQGVVFEEPVKEPVSITDYAIAAQNLKRCGVIDQNGKLNPMYDCILIKRKRND